MDINTRHQPGSHAGELAVKHLPTRAGLPAFCTPQLVPAPLDSSPDLVPSDANYSHFTGTSHCHSTTGLTSAGLWLEVSVLSDLLRAAPWREEDPGLPSGSAQEVDGLSGSLPIPVHHPPQP